MTEKETADLNRERERQRTVNAYHRVFEGADGKTVMEDIRRSFSTDSQAFLPGHDFNPIVAAIRDGQRGVLLHIQSMLCRTVVADSNIEVPKAKVKRK
jgi:hypothetical protein